MRNEDELIAEARNCLLTHFSSKSTNQTAILLGLAVAFFADIQAYNVLGLPLLWEQIAFLTVSLGAIIFFVIRAVGRLVYWGLMAGIVFRVKAADNNDVIEWLNVGKPESYPKSEIDSTYLARVIRRSQEYFQAEIEQRRTVAIQVYRATNSERFRTACLAVVLEICFLSFMLSEVFHLF